MGPQEQQQTPQPAQPAPQVMTPQPVVSKKGLSKGALWGIIGGSVGLLLIIIGVIVAVLLLGPPSKADYQAAYTKSRQMVTKYNSTALGGSFNDELKNVKTTSDVDAALDKIKAEYDKDNAELAGMKALNDKDVKDAFNAYKKKYDESFPYLKDVMKSALSYKDINEKCGYTAISSMSYSTKDKATAQSDYDVKSKPCLDLLKTLSSSNNDKMSKFAKAYEDYIGKMREYVGAYAEASGKSDYSTMGSLKRPSLSSLPYASDLMPTSSDKDKYDFSSAFNEFVSILNRKR